MTQENEKHRTNDSTNDGSKAATREQQPAGGKSSADPRRDETGKGSHPDVKIESPREGQATISGKPGADAGKTTGDASDRPADLKDDKHDTNRDSAPNTGQPTREGTDADRKVTSPVAGAGSR